MGVWFGQGAFELGLVDGVKTSNEYLDELMAEGNQVIVVKKYEPPIQSGWFRSGRKRFTNFRPNLPLSPLHRRPFPSQPSPSPTRNFSHLSNKYASNKMIEAFYLLIEKLSFILEDQSQAVETNGSMEFEAGQIEAHEEENILTEENFYNLAFFPFHLNLT